MPQAFCRLQSVCTLTARHMHTRVAYCYRSLFIPHPQKITVPQTAKLCALNLFGRGNEL